MAEKEKTKKTGAAKRKKGKAKSRASTLSESKLKTFFINRITKRLFAIVMILISLPIVFTFIYTIPGTKPVSTLMMGRALTGQPVERKWVDLEDVAPVVYQSVVMSEDGQFCGHRGVDWNELNAVIDNALDGERTRGASTIAMQTAKNLFLWPHRSFIRKAFEVPYAIFADFILGKKRLMEIYLNIAEWDEGVFGIEAASQHYFNRPASRLSRRQAALLTVSLPNPKGRNPAKPTKSLQRLARVIEKRAKQSGAYIKCLQE